ncbi:MAG: hypothetical protein QNL91_17660 [Candidatus Krumholzibacteria bacterium]|nr:hypothetical protein [Candidatus Krumholzibacteria bacterium]
MQCPNCGQPIRPIAFILDPPVIERAPPQTEIHFNQVTGPADWPDMDQTAGESDDTWG